MDESLEARLARDGTLPLTDVLFVAREVLVALGEMHARRIAHHAVHPANVVFERHGLIERVRLVDGGTRGGFAYMAPEQVRGSRGVDARADLYAVGAIVFRALTGRLPFEGTNALTLIALKLDRDPPGLASASGRAWPADLERFVATSMRRDPDQRYSSAQAALEALRSIE